MALKTILLPHLGINFKFGRTRSTKPSRQRLQFRDYAKKINLPATPPAEDWSSAASGSLGNVYLNDQLGDCVIAGMYHCLGVWTGNAGNQFIATNDQITKDYSAIGGYVPGDSSTDQGCNEGDALDWWLKNGFANGDTLAGHLSVDATNETELQQAIYLFETLYFGVELPDGWLNPMPQASGFQWDVSGSPDQNNGHCVMGMKYTTAGVVIDTWAMTGTVTWAALAKYMVTDSGGETHLPITQSMIAAGQAKAPNGFAWSDLIADFDSLGGNLPIPAPVNPPTPPPTPGPSPIPPPTPYPDPSF